MYAERQFTRSTVGDNVSDLDRTSRLSYVAGKPVHDSENVSSSLGLVLFIACLVGFATGVGHALGIDRLCLELGLGVVAASVGAGLVGTVGILTVIVVCMKGAGGQLAGLLVALFWIGVITAFTPFPDMAARWFAELGVPETWTLFLSGLSGMLLTIGSLAAMFMILWTGMFLADLKRPEA